VSGSGAGPRLGILTGTFDPVHRGHIALAKAALVAGGLDGVLLMVNPAPEHKTGVAALADRLEMTRLAVADEPGLGVYDGVLAGEPQVAATFAALARELGSKSVVFVMGIDTLARLDRWPDVESVVKNATYLAARRGGVGDAEVAALRQRLGPLGSALRVQLFEFNEAAGASSAQVRAAVRAGEPTVDLDPMVRDFIERKGLYH